MKRLVLEIPYEMFWARFFGRNADRVKVVEALKCFKCDNEGFACVCKIRLGGGVKLADLREGGAIETVESLYEEQDGSVVVFISGYYPRPPRSPEPKAREKVFLAGPPEFLDVNRMRYALVGEERDVHEYLRRAERRNPSLRILSLTQLGTKQDSPISTLTARQRQVLMTAYGLGYYDVPRRISSRDMASLLKMDKSTLAEHLRKAERRMVKSIMAG